MKIEYDDGHVIAEIEITPATVRMGLERSRLIADVDDVEGADPIDYYTRKLIHPSLIAASQGTVKVGGKEIEWPLTFDQFLDLPDKLAQDWAEAVRKVNPHWFELPEPDEKKAIESSKEQ